jgi:hypothetical protein
MKKKKAKAKSNKPYHLLVYIEKCSTKMKKFDTKEEMGRFVDDFNKKHPDYADQYSDYWVDYAITDVSGDIHFFTDSMRVK